jgi:4-amino-4-deoxy-L-arabinose transferase-like glycosyltransferase
MRIYNSVTGVAWLLFAFWFVVPLGVVGLFDDGVFYGVIARNWIYAADSANWWQLKVSNGLDANFGGHPPMAFWLQSILFRIFGEYPHWIERVYSLLMAVATLQGLRALWNNLLPEKRSLSYLPVVFWLLMPIVGWSYGNNMLENTLAAFAIWAVWAQLKFWKNQNWKSKNWKNQNFVYLLLAAALIIGASMSKGPVGLFPLITLPILALAYRNANQNKFWVAVGASVFLTTLVAAFYFGLCYFSLDARVFWLRYINLQLVPSISGAAMATSRYLVLQKIIEENAISLAILALFFFFQRYKKIAYKTNDCQVFIFFLTTAFSASLPIMLSPKQLGFYLVPALPFFALAWAALALPFVDFLRQKPQPKFVAYGLILGQAACVLIMFLQWGRISRNHDLIHDVFLLRPLVAHKTIGLHQSLYNQWNLHGYMYRFAYCDLSTEPRERDFWLLPQNDTLRSEGYTRLDLPLRQYHIYKRVVVNSSK